MADPIVNFFKSTLVGTYSDSATSLTIATGDGALLPDPSTDGAFNLTIFEGLQVTNSTSFEIVRVTARSGDVLTVTRGAENTTPLTIGSSTHSILMSATKKTFDDINDAIDNVNVTTLTGVEELTFDTTGDEEFGLPAGTTAQRPASPSAGYMRWNSTDSRIEFYNGSRWAGLSEIGLEQVSLGVAQLSVTANDMSVIAGYTFQGSSFGYASGGDTGSRSNIIDKYSFTSDSNATDVGDLTVARRTSGNTSETHGYSAGGEDSSSTSNVIDKFSFSTDGNATDVGDLAITAAQTASQSSEDNGYACGGAGGETNTIQKFSFASDGNATDIADMTISRRNTGGQSSETHGYNSGGNIGGGNNTNVIDKFPFASDSNATDVGDLTQARRDVTGNNQSSETHGYTSGGFISAETDIIDKFSFSSDGNASDVGDLIGTAREGAGASSTTHGYYAGGGFPTKNTIQKFTFSSDNNATDVADLTVARHSLAGHQV